MAQAGSKAPLSTLRGVESANSLKIMAKLIPRSSDLRSVVRLLSKGALCPAEPIDVPAAHLNCM